jgi:hypothetical protein
MRIRLPRLSDADRLFRRVRLGRTLGRHLPPLNDLTRVVVAGPGLGDTDHRLRLAKEGHRLVVQFDHRRILRDDMFFFQFSRRLGVLMAMFARAGATLTEAYAEISDGWESGDGWISFCSRLQGAILIPDHDFYNSRGYSDMRSLGREPGPGWADRRGGFCWRGSSTGKGGVITTEEMVPGDDRLIQRTRVCLSARSIPDADIKYAKVVQSTDEALDLARLQAAGIMGESIDASSWRIRKFALDVDGNSNAWQNLFTRLLLGCCVIKIASPQGFHQWYYHRMRPFEHYVPVAADLSDLAQQLEWCRTHDRECAEIAAAGQELALGMTFEGELALGAKTIAAAGRR